jgi:hypothetical protein
MVPSAIHKVILRLFQIDTEGVSTPETEKLSGLLEMFLKPAAALDFACYEGVELDRGGNGCQTNENN